MAGSTSTDSLDHGTIQPLAIALIFLFPTLATVSLALRAYSRTLTGTFGADDVVIGFAGVSIKLSLYYLEGTLLIQHHRSYTGASHSRLTKVRANPRSPGAEPHVL